jgi:hypothetical protein
MLTSPKETAPRQIDRIVVLAPPPVPGVPRLKIAG